MRPSWIEVDLDAVAHNVATIVDAVAPSAVWAVVKADAYGHGDVPVAETALRSGAAGLGVALVEEAVRLREAGIDAPVLLLSEPDPSDLDVVVRLGITPTVYRREAVARIADAVRERSAERFAVHLKVDTGMHRVGAAPVEAFAVARAVAADRRLTLGAIWTHFPVSEADGDYTMRQVRALEKFTDALAAEGIEVPVVHAANTAGALAIPSSRFDLVRVGLGIYGLRPAPNIAADLELRPAMRVVSHISYLRRLPAGARPSYGRVRELAAASTVATVPIGYADGVPRRYGSSGGEVLIGGRRFPLAGTVTMDQLVVDLGDTDAVVGDEVVLLGRQGDEEITADEWARRLDTINYEVVTRFGPRLPRRYRGTDHG